MAPRHATLRRKLYTRFSDGVVPQHGHFLEYSLVAINLFVSVAFVYGSATFLFEDLAPRGAWIFATGSAIVFFSQIFSFAEERQHSRHCNFCDPIVNRRQGVELREHCTYLVAGFLFALGSCCYVPGVCRDGASCQSWGSGFLIVGSLGFVLASSLNAIAIAASGDERRLTPIYMTCRFLTISGLTCSQMGSVLFFAASSLYRPELSSACGSTAPSGSEIENTHECVQPAALGACMYILGSLLYVAEAGADLATCALKHVHGDEQVAKRDARVLFRPLLGS